jgi:type IV pilus assembly protein PilY1
MNTLTHVWPSLATSVAQRLGIGLRAAALLASACLTAPAAQAGVSLADQPVFTNTGVPGNLALALSVEFPTAVSVAHIDTAYSSAKTFLGYFDPNKCYLYNYNQSDETDRYFYPQGAAAARVCTASKWSGNFLNWATMQTIDPFRWALTGGYRSKDTNNITLLEKAWASGQGGSGNFPNKSLTTAAEVSSNTSLGWSALYMRIWGLGNKMRFTRTGDLDGEAREYDPSQGLDTSKVYELSVRVKVCDTSAAAGALESNCTAYPSGGYKPTGLLQQYAEKIRYSAFGYLNDDDILRDGGVLRARQKFIGPVSPRPNATPLSNAATEWDSTTGVMNINPDTADASDTATLFGVPMANSGVMNYLNKFGQITPGGYKTYDPVGELYYAAVRYFKKLGNVPEWTDMSGKNTDAKKRLVDGFPVITEWDDPIQYSCQRNFILGIGDVNTHADKNVPGSTNSASEPAMPAKVTADTSVNAVTATNAVGAMHGLGASLGTVAPYGGCCSYNAALMAGLAYDSHTKDIRPDDASKPQTKGMQTISTYWLDILEYSQYKADNQFYLAAKYGGFKVPDGFSPYAQSADIPKAWWSTSGETVGSQSRPDNYYVASQPDQMVSGLKRAFASIAGQLRAYSTSLSTAVPQLVAAGSNSFSAQYDSGTWTGEVTANVTSFNTSGEPSFVPAWNFSDKLATQIASDSGKGWDTARRIATYRNADKVGVPFRLTDLGAAEKGALDTVFRGGNDSADFLNYLRGDPTHEESSADPASSKAYRNRVRPVGDIVGSRARVVGPPAAVFSSAANPGYNTFKNDNRNRQTMVYVGTNAGMLHGINASMTGTNAGTEVFAYVPGALYQGPSATPQVNGLQSRGDPDFAHRFFVDSTPVSFDIDFGRTPGGSGTNWRTILVGGLGKGGKSYYALDVTDPSVMTSETAVAGKVLWEFSHAKLGFTFGEPIAVKMRKYGWVLVFGSGYNNSDGQGYFFIVNPRTGELLESPIATGAGNGTDEAGLAHVQAFVLDRTDFTADTLYAGDLLGNLWRLDVTGTSGSYGPPVLMAKLTNKADQALPVTSRPLVVIQPNSNRRWVVAGTGRLLNNADVGGGQAQGFFAIMDGNALRPNSAAQLPTGMTFPLARSNLKELTDLTTKITLDLATQIGWWFDLGTSAGLGWRVLSDPTNYYSEVSFTTMLPSVSDACSPSGTSRVYSIDLGTGQSRLVDSTGAVVAYASPLPGVITNNLDLSVDKKRVKVVCSDNGGCKKVDTKPLDPLAASRLNWRELPLAD